jgi:hypothetical protein
LKQLIDPDSLIFSNEFIEINLHRDVGTDYALQFVGVDNQEAEKPYQKQSQRNAEHNTDIGKGPKFLFLFIFRNSHLKIERGKTNNNYKYVWPDTEFLSVCLNESIQRRLKNKGQKNAPDSYCLSGACGISIRKR